MRRRCAPVSVAVPTHTSLSTATSSGAGTSTDVEHLTGVHVDVDHGIVDGADDPQPGLADVEIGAAHRQREP